jgi:hypothetical protein
MRKTAQVLEKISDFQQMDLPLVLGKGEKVLLRTRLVADSALGAWYELYLVGIPHGYLIEKHSGVSTSHGRQKEIWFRRNLTEAERKFSKIIDDKINPLRRSPRKYRVVTTMSASDNIPADRE